MHGGEKKKPMQLLQSIKYVSILKINEQFDCKNIHPAY